MHMLKVGAEDYGGVGCHQDVEGSEHQPTDFRLYLISDRELLKAVSDKNLIQR